MYDADLQSYFDTIPHEKLMACVQRRIADGSVLKLIRAWLAAVIVEPGDGPGDPPRHTRSGRGTPQGGVISPLLANLYLHWFDVLFHGPSGPHRWADARLVRYADDFVIMARHVGDRIGPFVERTLHGRFDLRVNPAKTRTVRMTEPRASLDFLGYTFRYDRDLLGRGHRYLNLVPSRRSMQRSRDRLRDMTGPQSCLVPVPELIGRVNRYLAGWGNYFGKGYPRMAFREVNRFAQERLARHLKRRSQRPFRLGADLTWYAQLKRLGLTPL